MDSDTAQHQFSLLEKIPPSIDLHLATQPVQPSTPTPHSPIRRLRSPQHELDSFLADIEPSFILEALTVTSDAPAPHTRSLGDGTQSRQAFISNAVAGASSSEREWGIRAAKAGKNIQEWHDELANWPWSQSGQANGFQTQYEEDELAKSAAPNGPAQHRSSILSSEIKVYEARIERIKQNLGMLELEKLKGHVLDVHVTPNSKRITQQMSTEDVSYDHVDDFQAIITATIVQSLPILAKLDALMSIWSIRLETIRLIPDFMRGMASCKDSMLSAQMAIGSYAQGTTASPSDRPTLPNQRKSFSRHVYEDMQAVLNDQISETGRKLDNMLDLLEGSIDVLPEQWIDGMDELEEQQRRWAVEAEKLVQDRESHQMNAPLTIDNSLPGLESSRPKESQIPDYTVHELNLRSSSDVGENMARLVGAVLTTSNPEIDQSFDHRPPAASLVRNFSVGVRKPSGSPKDGGLDLAERSSISKPSPLSIETAFSNAESSTNQDPSSYMSPHDSSDSESFSIGSSPEIQSATLAEYPGLPVQVMTPTSSRPSFDYVGVSKQPDLSSPRTRKSWNGVPSDHRPRNHQRKRSSTFSASPSPSQGGDSSYLQAGDAVLGLSPDRARPRSASIKSFEVVPRSEVRTIDVKRSRDTTISLKDLGNEVRTSSPAARVAELPRQNSDGPSLNSELSAPALTMAQDRFTPDEPPPEPAIESGRQTLTANLTQFSFPKPRKPSGVAPFLASRIPKKASPQRASTMGNVATIKPTESLPINEGDRLEARINSILTQIPANIRLTSATESTAGSPNMLNKTNPPKSKTSRLSMSRFIRSKTSSPTPSAGTPSPTTLSTAIGASNNSPSDPRTNGISSGSGSSQVKIYHLHQPGSAPPTKLYIRLVGETGERVMVRVGGGWADLAEYLKEYALHHGKRAVSENHFKIHNFPVLSQSPGNSRPSSSSSSSAALHRQRNTTAGTPTAPPAAAAAASSMAGTPPIFPPPNILPPNAPLSLNPPNNPPPSFTSPSPFNPGLRRASASAALPSARNRALSTASLGDVGGSIGGHSDPTSLGGPVGGPVGALSNNNNTNIPVTPPMTPNLGLAGPSAKRHLNISPRKQAWVDGMMRQARRRTSFGTATAGGGVDRGDGGLERDVGAVKGTKGGVRRVFLGMGGGRKE